VSGRFARGLVVGKFCPLHRGHELLIRHALERCDTVTLVSYTQPEFPGCGPAVRELWLAEAFPAADRLVVDDALLAAACAERGLPARRVPDNDAPASEHRTFVAWLLLAVRGETVDAVFTSEDYGDGFAALLTDVFRGAGFATPVRHVCVDPARTQVPISGTAIRADVHGQRAHLAPHVYASFIERVCFLGGESTGKTTLAEEMAARLGTAWVPEYGRELWERKDGKLVFEDMVEIGRAQCAREDALALRARRWLFCDTSPLTTLLYSRFMFGRADPRLEEMAERPYDHLVLCAPDFAFVTDGTRQDEPFQRRQHEWYLRELGRRGLAFHLVEGGPEQRVARVCALLGAASFVTGARAAPGAGT